MTSPLTGKNILLGVSAGIAAYKAADLASKINGAGAKVVTILTENTTRLIGPKTFEAVTANLVATDMWQLNSADHITHINLADEADIVVVAPATADIIAKAALGICDDLLSTTLCACWQKPVLFAPAMNERMWLNPAVQRNVEQLKDGGFHIMGPETGKLACGTSGIGRMSEPARILEALEQIASKL